MSTLATDDLDEQLRIVSGRIADGDVSDETQALLDNLNRIKEAIAKGAMQSHVEGLEAHADTLGGTVVLTCRPSSSTGWKR